MNDVVLTAGNHLQIRFVRRGDRWGHTIEARQAEEIVWRLESQELWDPGSGESESWPPSPPLQSLQLVEVPSRGQVALLLGMAGATHWSASVETDPIGARISFDIACRVSEKPASLGSSYSIVSDDGGMGTLAGDKPFVVVADSPAPDAARCSIETTERKIVVSVATEGLQWPQTVRWRYSVSLSALR